MAIIETGRIRKPKDLLKLDIVDFNRLIGYWDNSHEALEAIASWLIESYSHYSILHIDMRKAPSRDDWPGWNHVGLHPEMGQLYWNWFQWRQKGKITFSDSPDFYGNLHFSDNTERYFCGDIGKVSAPTFARSLRLLGEHDVWISIVNEQTQIMIEPMTSIAKLWDDFCSEMFGSSQQETKTITTPKKQEYIARSLWD